MTSKYRAKITKIHYQGEILVFRSKREAQRFHELLMLREAKAISDLAIQPSWKLIVNGVKVGKYTADFYYKEGGADIYEDVKGYMTAAQKFRLKVFYALYPDVVLRIIK